jgi:hypothetical protein
MKKTLLLSIALLWFTITAFSQSATVKGTVADLSANVKLKNATVAILNAKDSILYKFTRANQDGNFTIENLKKGVFILLVTYPEYADFVSSFSIDSASTTVDFKIIDLKTKAKLLNEVLIKGQAAEIKIKGDTTEFNAAAYNIQPNDRVEDLLKKFPGVTVDAQGKITAQGKTVEKVLVDGEEFFGDDPTLVTKNLRADMVDKVQLFEKSSDQAAFTGVDDGQKKQTLNVILKEDKKNGYFGKIDAGYGTDDFYQVQAMFNKFKNKEKMAAYFTSSNTGKTGLGWEDAGKYGSNNNIEVNDDGMIFITSSDELDGGGRYWGEGIPLAHNGGLHYENKWNSDKESINTNYKVGSLNIKIDKNTLEQRNLPNAIFNTESNEDTDNSMFRQKVDVTYIVKLDTTSILKVKADGTLRNSQNNLHHDAIARRGDNSLLNTVDRTTNNNLTRQQFGFNALYTKKLKKAGRNYSVNLSQAYDKTTSEGYLISVNRFFNEDSSFDRQEDIDQLKENTILTNRLSANLTYNEPISKFFSLVANYGLTYTINDANRITYDASAPEIYDRFNSEFSNNFEANQLLHQVGAIFNYKKGKTVITFGNKTSFVNFDQTEVYTNQNLKRNFLNWLPQASYQYKFSAQKSFRISYNGSTMQPSVNQLQPVRVNDDPLNIFEGNDQLGPAYNNRISVDYNSYKIITRRNLYMGGNFNFINNQIVNNNTTDASGKTTFKTVNLSSHLPFSYGSYIGFSRKVKILGGINTGVNLNANGSRFYNYVNGDLNTTNSHTINASINLSKYNDKGNFYLSFGPSYNTQETSLQMQANNNGWGYRGYYGLSIKLPKKITISSEAEYEYQPASSSFNQSFDRFLINAALIKAFFKEEKLKLMLSANDILKQNVGFRRFASTSSITQTSYNNISRYFMFSLIWDFNKMGGALKAN